MKAIYSSAEGEYQAFVAALRTGQLIEVTQELYEGFRTSEEVVTYPYALLFTDGTRRVCAFAYLVGDEQSHPYIGFWMEAGRYFCKALGDRLEATPDGYENFLPPLRPEARRETAALSDR